MGKAYSEEEREEIRKRIWDEAVNLLHEDTNKTVNMRELTERVGISLGCFYNFYKDKKSLIHDVMTYRVKQKLKLIKKTFPASLNNPKQYVYGIIYDNFKDMGEKLLNKDIYKEMYQIAFEGNSKEINYFLNVYEELFRELAQYWETEQTGFQIDEEGMMSLIRGITFFNDAGNYMQEKYFELLLQMIIRGAVEQFITEEQ